MIKIFVTKTENFQLGLTPFGNFQENFLTMYVPSLYTQSYLPPHTYNTGETYLSVSSTPCFVSQREAGMVPQVSNRNFPQFQIIGIRLKIIEKNFHVEGEREVQIQVTDKEF